MQMFTEDELGFAKIDGVGSIAMVKRIRTLEPYDVWYVIDQVKSYGGYRKRTTRTYTDFMAANEDYQKKLALMKVKGVSEWSRN